MHTIKCIWTKEEGRNSRICARYHISKLFSFSLINPKSQNPHLCIQTCMTEYGGNKIHTKCITQQQQHTHTHTHTHAHTHTQEQRNKQTCNDKKKLKKLKADCCWWMFCKYLMLDVSFLDNEKSIHSLRWHTLSLFPEIIVTLKKQPKPRRTAKCHLHHYQSSCIKPKQTSEWDPKQVTKTRLSTQSIGRRHYRTK